MQCLSENQVLKMHKTERTIFILFLGFKNHIFLWVSYTYLWNKHMLNCKRISFFMCLCMCIHLHLASIYPLRVGAPSLLLRAFSLVSTIILPVWSCRAFDLQWRQRANVLPLNEQSEDEYLIWDSIIVSHIRY